MKIFFKLPMTEKRPAISVIVPVYNAEDTLQRCIDSIRNQTFADFELIIVDDGSQDGSWNLCKKLLLSDSRIHIFHQTNQGQAAARAKGTRMSQGTWLSYVDDDDFLMPTALESLYAKTNSEIDIVMGNASTLRGESRMMIPMDEFRHLAVKGEGAIGLIWGHLFRRDLVTDYAFDIPNNIRTGEDYIFWLRLVFSSTRPVALTYQKVYCKGKDHFSSHFVWTASYAQQIHILRKNSIPVNVRQEYIPEMIEDRIDNLFSIAVSRPKCEWINSDFYREIVEDMLRTGTTIPLKRRIFLKLPARWLRRLYSHLSDVKALLKH